MANLLPLILFIIGQLLKQRGKLAEWTALDDASKQVVASAVAYKYQAIIGNGDFLKWLIENADEIIELITKIIGLFGDKDVTVASDATSLEALCATLES